MVISRTKKSSRKKVPAPSSSSNNKMVTSDEKQDDKTKANCEETQKDGKQIISENVGKDETGANKEDGAKDQSPIKILQDTALSMTKETSETKEMAETNHANSFKVQVTKNTKSDKVEKEEMVVKVETVGPEDINGTINETKTNVVDEALFVAQKLVDEADNKIEKEVTNEIGKKRIPVIEPVFIQERVETVGSIKDVKDDIIDAAKSVVQKVAGKIDNEIEKKVVREEMRDLTDNTFENKTEKEEKIEIGENRIPINKPVFIKESFEAVESIQDVKDGIIDAAKSVVEKVVENVDNEIEKKVEKAEMRDIIQVKDKKKISSVESEFTEEKIEPIESIQPFKDTATSCVQQKEYDTIDNANKPVFEEENNEFIDKIKNVVYKTDNEIEKNIVESERENTSEGNEPFLTQKHNENIGSNQDMKEAVTGKETSGQENDAIPITDNIAKLQAPSFTQLLEEAAKDDENKDPEIHVDTEQSGKVLNVALDVNGEDYYWITVGSFAVAILAVFITMLYFFLY